MDFKMKNLNVIHYYFRGESAFCSTECRYQAMLFDEAMD